MNKIDKYEEQLKSVIKSVSIPKWMDDEVKKRSLSLSRLLQNAILEVIDTYKEGDVK